VADRDWVPMPSGRWDEQPCTAPTQDRVDAIAALNMLRNRIPDLIVALRQVHAEVPNMLVEVLTEDVSPRRWLALAALCQEPGEILTGLAEACRAQAEDARQQIEEGSDAS
jgi:hypothetical protein